MKHHTENIPYEYIRRACGYSKRDKMDYESYRQISLHGANLEIEGYWHTRLWGEVNKPCGEIFGQVFKQYDHVYMLVREGDGTREVVLTPDSHLLTVMRMLKMDLYHGDIDINCKHRP